MCIHNTCSANNFGNNSTWIKAIGEDVNCRRTSPTFVSHGGVYAVLNAHQHIAFRSSLLVSCKRGAYTIYNTYTTSTIKQKYNVTRDHHQGYLFFAAVTISIIQTWHTHYPQPKSRWELTQSAPQQSSIKQSPSEFSRDTTHYQRWELKQQSSIQQSSAEWHTLPTSQGGS